MKWLFGRDARGADAASRVPEGRLVYAVGDLHGRADLLDRMLGLIVSDAAESPGDGVALVCLGDYIDRGPQSRQVIERLLRLSAVPGLDLRCLRGNHEQSLLAFLDDPAAGPAWTEHGGDATLRSYGVEPPRLRTDSAAWARSRDAFAAALPPDHLAWLAQLPLTEEVGDYLFVHAGVRPQIPMREQTERDLLWIREPFLSWEGSHKHVVVHGHTPAEEAHMGRWRIGVDTGAYATGRLTALRLQGADRRLMQACAEARP